MGLSNIWRNLMSRGLKDVANPSVWRTMSDWIDIKQSGLTIPAEELEAYAKQVVYRETMCAECVKAGECVHCHCSIPDKMLIPNASCSAGKWGPMPSAAEWKEFEQKSKLEFITIINT